MWMYVNIIYWFLKGYITSSDLRSVLQCLGEQLTEDESNSNY